MEPPNSASLHRRVALWLMNALTRRAEKLQGGLSSAPAPEPEGFEPPPPVTPAAPPSAPSDDSPEGLFASANASLQCGRFQEALEGYDQALALRPQFAEALSNRGNALQGLARFDEAVSSYDGALAIRPAYAEAHINRGNALRALGRGDEALQSYGQAVALRPDLAVTFCNRGVALAEVGRHAEALDDFDRALSLEPGFVPALLHRAVALERMKRWPQALEAYDRAVSAVPGSPELFNNRGNVLQELGRHAEALASYDSALRLAAGFVPAVNNRANALLRLNRFEEALAGYDQALALEPRLAEAFKGRGDALHEMKRHRDAVASYDKAIALQPSHAPSHHGRGLALRELRDYAAAAESLRKAGELDPATPFLDGVLLNTRMRSCDWRGLDELIERVVSAVERGSPAAAPFAVLPASDSSAVHRRAAEIWTRMQVVPAQPRVVPAVRAEPQKIRVAYFSSDFHDHPVAYLVAELFEKHDRSKFEVIGVSFGAPSEDAMRRRIRAAVDRFVDVRTQSDADVALASRSMGLDIAVDLNAYTANARPGIFARRAAPVQVNYLGYPGTMGADFMDYLIADPVLIPESDRRHYRERIVELPDCYQPNDTKRPVGGRAFTRGECGLPEDGFVFCCFNNSYKILPETFGGWMRILQRVPGSVLWLLEDNAFATANLRREARSRGVDDVRLVFAPRVPLAEHLARHRLAGLFLDTFPYTAHTTASDALWAGLPVLTRMGESFPSRVAASLLKAVQMPDLVTTSQAQFEARAVELASTPSALSALRAALEGRRTTAPLFDIARYAGHLEAAYVQMVERCRAGLAPDPVHIRP